MSTPPLPPNIAEITAPMILGALWNWTLYGVLVVQTYVYSYNFPGDRTLLKLLVYSVFLVETVQTALTGADLYHWFGSGFGHLDHLTVYLSGFDVPIIGSIVSLTVQVFFMYRIWMLSGRSSWFLCLIICLCSIVSAVAAFYGGIYAYSHKNKFVDLRLTKTLALIWLSGNASADTLIAGSLLFHLGRRRKEGGQFSDHALSKVVRLTIETNVLTTTVGVISLLMVAVYSEKRWFTCPTAILGKLYSNTFLVSLNNRITLREGRSAVIRSPPGTFAFTTSSRSSRPTSEIMHVEFMKPSAAVLVPGPPEDGTGQDTNRIFNIA